jgi:hypothetical protein
MQKKGNVRCWKPLPEDGEGMTVDPSVCTRVCVCVCV